MEGGGTLPVMTPPSTAPSPALRAALAVPRWSWPTLALWGVALGCWGSGVLGVASGAGWLGGAAMVLGGYLAFTPMHDAAHRSVARLGWVNEVVGRLAAVTLFGPFPAFRYVHLEHHKHTNDPQRDPDYWSGLAPAWALPLRWMTQDLHYYVSYLRGGRPRPEVMETAATFVLYLGISAWLLAVGQGGVVVAWVVASRLAMALLACGFDYLPHRPHLITNKEDRYRATSVRQGLGWQVLLLNQNLHLLHHLNPAVPFYRYGTLWAEQREVLLSRGVVVVNAAPREPGVG